MTTRPVPTKGARSRALGAGTAGGAVAEMRRRGLRDQAGDIRRGWCGGRCGRDAASMAAAQAVRHPAHLPCATSGGYQGLSTGGRRSKPQTPRAGRRRFGGLAALKRLGKPRCREAPRPVGPAGSRRSARPLFFRRRANNQQNGRSGARISKPRAAQRWLSCRVQSREVADNCAPRTLTLPWRGRVASEARRGGVELAAKTRPTPHPAWIVATLDARHPPPQGERWTEQAARERCNGPTDRSSRVLADAAARRSLTSSSGRSSRARRALPR